MKTSVLLATGVLMTTATAFAQAPPAEAPSSGTTIDRANISAGIAKIRSKIAACGDQHPAQGTVKTKVKVAPSGSVQSVQITATPEAGLGDCVAAVMKRAVFGKTDRGGSFAYPFVFRQPSAPSPTPGGSSPDALDRKAISEGIARIKPAIVACGDRHKSATGIVKVNVKVKPAGSVESAVVREAPEPELGACVSKAILKATFQPTKNGGSFSYPFKF